MVLPRMMHHARAWPLRVCALLLLPHTAHASCAAPRFGQRDGELDMRRWRVASDRDVGAARDARAFGSYTFNVSDGSETFPL